MQVVPMKKYWLLHQKFKIQQATIAGYENPLSDQGIFFTCRKSPDKKVK